MSPTTSATRERRVARQRDPMLRRLRVLHRTVAADGQAEVRRNPVTRDTLADKHAKSRQVAEVELLELIVAEDQQHVRTRFREAARVRTSKARIAPRMLRRVLVGTESSGRSGANRVRSVARDSRALRPLRRCIEERGMRRTDDRTNRRHECRSLSPSPADRSSLRGIISLWKPRSTKRASLPAKCTSDPHRPPWLANRLGACNGRPSNAYSRRTPAASRAHRSCSRCRVWKTGPPQDPAYYVERLRQSVAQRSCAARSRWASTSSAMASSASAVGRLHPGASQRFRDSARTAPPLEWLGRDREPFPEFFGKRCRMR